MSTGNDDIAAARQEHQAWMKTWQRGLLYAAGVLFFASAVLAGLGKRLTPVGPDLWGFPFALALIAVLGACYCLYSARPIPNEPLHAPIAPELVTDQIWREPAKRQIRFLERLKGEALEAEQQITRAHQLAVQAYRRIPQTVSYSEYREAKSELYSQELIKTNLLRQLPPIYERIGKIFGGDVDTEVLDIKEQIKKLQREKTELDRLLNEGQAEVNRCSAPDCEDCKAWPGKKQGYHNKVYIIDHRIIELETDLAELENFDFRALWRELELPGPEGLSRIPKERIDSMKAKIETINEIPSLKNRRPQPSPDEVRQQNMAKLEKKILELKTERAQKLTEAAGDDRKWRRYENFYDDAIAEIEEQSDLPPFSLPSETRIPLG